jgi:plastocyanin
LNKWGLGILVIAALGVFGYDLFFQTPLSAKVVMTDTKYSPEVLRIKKGTTVIFENQGAQPHWPASNYHPTHTLYPEEGGCIGSAFDACRGLNPGEIYEFRFDIIGTWPVHDHINPGLTMVIEVVEDVGGESKAVSNFNLTNLPTPDEFRELSYSDQDVYVNLMSVDDPINAWKYVKQAFYVDNQVIRNAHEFSHTIGNALYNQLGLAGIINCDATFAYGCYHGVTEELLSEQGIDAIIATQERCVAIYPPNDSNLYTGCIHGMGHGLLTWEALNVQRALRGCDLLDDGYRNYCYDGVFMENSFLAIEDEYDIDKFWNFCLDLADRYHYNCGRYQVQRIFSEFSYNFGSIGAECAKAPNDTFKTTCSESIGYYAGQTATGNPESILSTCSQIIDREVRNLCVIGAARETIFQAYQDWQTNSTFLCESLSPEWRQKCLDSNTKVKLEYNRV